MELQVLDQQLKGAIQNHQVLVAKMKNDPQNGVLQKQLHDLQSQIKVLSERQKQVVQQLRLDLEIKQQQASVTNNSVTVSSSVLPNHTQTAVIRTLPQQTAPLSLTTKQVDLRSAKGITVSATILLPSKVHITATPTPAVLGANCGSDSNRTPLAPVGGSVTVNSNNNANNNNNATVMLRTADSTTLAIPQPPIRVPQYPPPHARVASLIHLNNQRPIPVSSLATTPTTVANSTTATSGDTQVTYSISSITVGAPPALVKLTTTSKSPSVPQTTSVKQSVSERSTVETVVKLKSSVDTLKTKFMAALGLITHDMLTELQSRRSERKRRTTANPQFSYGNWEHPNKKCKKNNYLSGSLPVGFRRPRGTHSRSRVGSATPTSSRPTTPEEGQQNGDVFSSEPSLRNGLVSKLQVDSNVCAMCRESGELVSCDVCSLSYHRRCLDDGKTASTDVSPWVCPKCLTVQKKSQQWPHSLAIVHSYIMHKTAKEEEKRKLLKRGIELKAEKNHLEQKVKQLTEALSLKVQKRSKLVSNTKETLQSIEHLKSVIRSLQAS